MKLQAFAAALEREINEGCAAGFRVAKAVSIVPASNSEGFYAWLSMVQPAFPPELLPRGSHYPWPEGATSWKVVPVFGDSEAGFAEKLELEVNRLLEAGYLPIQQPIPVTSPSWGTPQWHVIIAAQWDELKPWQGLAPA